MRLVLLSGGSGRRLWPLSNDVRSKQFLKLFACPNGKMESMIERVWRQLKTVNLSSSAIIATGRSQMDILQSQIGSDVPIVCEPMKRDTFPAIALAAAYLHDVEGADKHEVIVIIPSDCHADLSFFRKLMELEPVMKETDASLALIGIQPDHSSEKYGYIVSSPSGNGAPYEHVKSFVEKPAIKEARQLIAAGARWNSGVFAVTIQTIFDRLKKYGFPLTYEALIESYDQLPEISFDYAVVEKEKNCVVLPYEGQWKDVGTWASLTEEIKAPVTGKGAIFDASNTHVINELFIPISVLGIDHAIVAASPDGILIASKTASESLKKYELPYSDRLMYEERRWGSYKILEADKLSSGLEVLTKRLCVTAGKNISYQKHMQRTEVWTIIQGTGEMILDGEKHSVMPGDVFIIPAGVKHAIKAETDLDMIEVQTGTKLVEEDIIRFAYTWEEIEAMFMNDRW